MAIAEPSGRAARYVYMRMSKKSRRQLLLCAGLAIAAFAIRLIVSAQLLSNDVQVSNPSGMTDMWTYKDLAERILKGEYVKEFYYQPFYYAIFLPLAHMLFGASAWAVIVSQALLGAGTVYICSLAASLLWGRRAGLFAGILAAFSAALILYTPYRLIETLQAFWISLLFLCGLQAFRKGGCLRWAICGLILSFSILTRGNSWLLAPPLLAACLYGELRLRATNSRAFPRALACVALLLAMSLIPQIPFGWRNSVSKGALCGPSTAGPAVLALGNTPEAPPGGRNPGWGPGPMEYPPCYQIWMDASKERSVPGRILEWASKEPLAFLELTFRKMLLFWDWPEIPNNIAFELQGKRSSIFNALGFIPTGLMLALAAAGILSSLPKLRARKGSALLVCFLIAYWLAVSAFYILARFRVPIIPLMAVMGAGFIELCARDLLKRRFRAFFIMKLGALAIGLALTGLAYDFYRFEIERHAMKLARPNGTRVEVSKDETMILDNGPQSFGSWTPVKIEIGDRIVKRFIVPTGFKSAQLSIECLWETPGGAIIAVNGERKLFKAPKAPGPGTLDFELPASPDGSYAIEAVRVDAALHLIIDCQRDYARTLIDGKPAPGELVARLRLKN